MFDILFPFQEKLKLLRFETKHKQQILNVKFVTLLTNKS